MSEVAQILRSLDREVWLLTAEHESRRAGMIATSVNDASIAPEAPRILVGIARQHYTWNVVAASRAFRLHLLDESQLDVVWHYGLRSGHDVDKSVGAPELHSEAWLDCKVETSMDTGDRTVYLAEIVAGRLEKNTRPLTMKRLLELAPPERLLELRAGLQRDGAIDADAIRNWRNAKEPRTQ